MGCGCRSNNTKPPVKPNQPVKSDAKFQKMKLQILRKMRKK